MPKRNIHRFFLLLLLLADLMVLSMSFGAIFWVRFFSGWVPHAFLSNPKWYAWALLVSLLVQVFVFKYTGLYRQRHSISGADEFGSIFKSVTISFILLIAATFFIRTVSFSRIMLSFNWALNILFLAVSRGILRRLQIILRRRGFGVTRCLIVGTSDAAWSTYERLRTNLRYGYRVLGFVRPSGKALMAKHFKQRVVGQVSQLGQLIRRYEIEEIFVAVSGSDDQHLIKIIEVCSGQGVEVKIIPDVFHLITGPVHVDDIQGMPIFGLLEEPLEKTYNRFIKRTMDIILSFIGIVVLSPVWLVIMVLIKLDSKGPVFFKQERVGRDNKIFWTYKFRSMRMDAETHSGPVWASRDDQRCTRLGRVLRKTSLDELPQLLNILKGDMSLVGPRPERPHFVNQFKNKIPRYLERHKVRAGLTGWAQVNGLRGNTSIEERVKYDIYYIENWSLLLDVTIILRTVLDILEHKHAY